MWFVMGSIHLDILEALAEEFEDDAEVIKWRGKRELGTLYIKTLEPLAVCIDRVKKVLKDIEEIGEVIEAQIGRGLFIDSGMETLEIIGGRLFEIYFFGDEAHLYIRIYDLIYQSDRWTAIYCDWSNPSPWWDLGRTHL